MRKYFILICLMVSWNCFAVWPSAPQQIPKLSDDCNQAKYFTLGTLCQDTDDGKLYKGTGAAVEELAAGSSGDMTKAEYDAGDDGVIDLAAGGTGGTTTTIGAAVATSTNPGAITFGRANADNTFSWLSDSFDG